MTQNFRHQANRAFIQSCQDLAAAYAAQVCDRGGKTDFRPDICDNLAELAAALSCASPTASTKCYTK